MEPDDPPAEPIAHNPRSRRRFATVDVKMTVCQPPDLNKAELELWRDIVDKHKPSWFYGCEALLHSYVSNVVIERALTADIAKQTPHSERWTELVQLRLQIVKVNAILATKLRLTPRSTIDRYQPKTVPDLGRKPWELDPEDPEQDDEPASTH